VSAYDILPYGGALSYLPSAELLLPTTAWGTNYVAAGPQPSTAAMFRTNRRLPSSSLRCCAGMVLFAPFIAPHLMPQLTRSLAPGCRRCFTQSIYLALPVTVRTRSFSWPASSLMLVGMVTPHVGART